MIIAKKVRLLPTNDQEKKLWQSAGTARWTYNWALNKQIDHFTQTGQFKKIDDGTLRKQLTQEKKTPELKWLNEVSNNVAKQAVKDLCEALNKFHQKSKKTGYKHRKSAIKSGKTLTVKDLENFPRFKSRKHSRASFYNVNLKLKVKKDSILIEKVGWVKLAEKNRIPAQSKYTNPRISFDNKYWYISVGIEEIDQLPVNSSITIGIDLGIKDLAIVSNMNQPIKNINKTKEVKKLKKKLKKKQKQVSRKYETNKIPNKKGGSRYTFIKTNNIRKLEQEIRLIHRRLNNIRLNHIHQATSAIVKTKPSRIVMEDLNVKGMMKNKHLSKAIQEQCFYKFVNCIEYKSKRNGIEFVKADRFYPSSKTCSCCGAIKKDLKLKDRVFICPSCGAKINRDMNAAINLSKYQKSA